MDSLLTEANSGPDVVTIFEDALAEEGLDAEVSHYTEPTRMKDVIRVTKEVNGEPVHHEQYIDFAEMEQSDSTHQLLAHYAGEVARQFEEYLTERIEWGDKCVRFDMKNGHSATCFRCGAEVDIEDLDRQNPMMAETAVPNPTTYTDFDKLPQVKIRMTLQAMLKEECDPMCPNSPHDGAYRKI